MWRHSGDYIKLHPTKNYKSRISYLYCYIFSNLSIVATEKNSDTQLVNCRSRCWEGNFIIRIFTAVKAAFLTCKHLAIQAWALQVYQLLPSRYWVCETISRSISYNIFFLLTNIVQHRAKLKHVDVLRCAHIIQFFSKVTGNPPPLPPPPRPKGESASRNAAVPGPPSEATYLMTNYQGWWLGIRLNF